MTNTHLSETRFKELPINEAILKGIEEAGFEFCTPVQALTLPLALQGKDISGQAQTGTGKTAAFLIACLNHLIEKEPKKSEAKNPIRSLILAPTRELAIQIFEDGKPLIKYTKLKMALAYGGTDYEKQRKTIEDGTDILVGTPGRVIDYLKQGVFSLKNVEVIILDEADRMFDLGFIDDIRYVFRNMPEPSERLNLLFSATLSHKVGELAYEHMNEPEIIKVESETVTAERITEIAYMPSNEDKIPLLLGLLKELKEEEKCVVFINTKHVAERLQAWTSENGFNSAVLSGDVPQRKRESLLKAFKEGKTNILIATDVAARGLHISDVSHVINYDLPTDAEDYVHRIGRTARAGASGTAISLICETYAMSLIDIEAFIEHSLPVEKSFEDTLFVDPKKPDLSKLRSNRRKPTRGSDKKGPRPANRRPQANSNSKSNFNDKPVDPKPKRSAKVDSESPEAKDVAKLARLEKQSQEPRKKPRIPLRGRSGQEIPLIG